MALIRLRGCAGWSAPLLFTSNNSGFLASMLKPSLSGLSLATRLGCSISTKETRYEKINNVAVCQTKISIGGIFI